MNIYSQHHTIDSLFERPSKSSRKTAPSYVGLRKVWPHQKGMTLDQNVQLADGDIYIIDDGDGAH